MVFVYNPQASSIRLFLMLFTVYVFGAGHWATFLGKDVELQKKKGWAHAQLQMLLSKKFWPIV